MRVLVAFDKFKHALTATDACALTAAALRAAQPGWTIDTCPLADGGEGFCEILTRAAGGELRTLTVTGPRGDPTLARFGLVPLAHIPAAARALLTLPEPPAPPTASVSAPNLVAVIEMAQASGLDLLPPDRRDPWHATTTGTGELLLAAHAAGARALLLGIGGSATHDLGLGALTALGLRALDSAGAPVPIPAPVHWPAIVRLEGRLPPDLPPVRIACDVGNPLLGPAGAAAIYGPQKGLARSRIQELDDASARLAAQLLAHFGRPASFPSVPGAGAAGGIAFGFLCATSGSRLVPGSDLVSAWLDLDARLAASDLVITGEGCFDDSSFSGKGPGALLARACQLGKPVRVFAGRLAFTAPPSAPGCRFHAITPAGQPLDEALRAAPALLTAAVRATFGALNAPHPLRLRAFPRPFAAKIPAPGHSVSTPLRSVPTFLRACPASPAFSRFSCSSRSSLLFSDLPPADPPLRLPNPRPPAPSPAPSPNPSRSRRPFLIPSP